MSMLNVFEPLLPVKDRAVFYTNLPGASLALMLTCLTRRSQGVVVVITANAQQAFELKSGCEFFDPDLPCLIFPEWETLAYDSFSPHQAIVSERLLTLNRLPHLQQGILITSVHTLLQRLPPVAYLASQVFDIRVGDSFALQAMRDRLTQAGYHAVMQVAAPGEFAVRGSVFDLFPTGSDTPFRLELFDEEIESIKVFDVDSQRSSGSVTQMQVLPAHEFPWSADSIRDFRLRFREQFAVNPSDCPVYQAVSQGQTPPGIEYYFPLFFDATASLFDYLPKTATFVRWQHLPESAESLWLDIRERYEQRCHDVTRPILLPVQLYLTTDEVFQRLKSFNQAVIQPHPSDKSHEFALETLPDVTLQSHHAFARLQQYLQQKAEAKVLFCAETAGRREALLELLKGSEISPKPCESWAAFLQQTDAYQIMVAPLDQGFAVPKGAHPAMVVVPEAALVGSQSPRVRRRKARDFDTELVIRNLSELQVGSPIVHVDHGVGRYQGLEVLQVGEYEGEFLKIHYQDSHLYVPVASLHLISRYSGTDIEHAPLHRLGSDQWQKAKRKAAEHVQDVAAELLAIYAKRAARQGFQYPLIDEHYLAFAASFPFEETWDQKAAIDAVIADMTSSRPMDRLVCGDVGFGKTEVALRAAFLAVQAGKQVAVLVPTTLLAQQHYENFANRMANWPIKVAVLSRFNTAKEQQEVLAQLATGRIDIVIGTHKLVQKDVRFHDLGLVVIDEEHRFGVKQKERLKALRSEVDVLAMTATPIPRTLNMAMAQIRDLSIIATPPAKRLAIKTFVREFNWPLIREAIARETLRGGQVYFLHNRVDTIENMAEDLRQLLPDIRFEVAHGQLHERDLERIMDDFHHQRFQVLVCSTIIETGIDIPNANTILINRADKFGLAQLHQLRGRVGRSHHQAYAYLLTPAKQALTVDAQRRLEAIETLEELGVGFALASHDLEIRGAGELLGEEQSGQMHSIGFSLYTDMLDQAVKALQRGESADFSEVATNDSDIDLHLPALIPADFVPDINQRLILYKRIASAGSDQALSDLQVEMIDRFGLLPEACKALFDVMHLKLWAKSWGVKKIEASASGGRIEFHARHRFDPVKLLTLIQTKPKHFKLDGPSGLKFFWQPEVARQERSAMMKKTLEHLL